MPESGSGLASRRLPGRNGALPEKPLRADVRKRLDTTASVTPSKVDSCKHPYVVLHNRLHQ
jgi:hypothetical protein